MTQLLRPIFPIVLAAIQVAACTPAAPANVKGTGGSAAAMGTGGATGTGGVANTGGGMATGGATNTGGSAATGGSTANGGSGGGLTAADCPEMPNPRRTSGTIIQLPLDISFQDKPFVFGEPNAHAAGGTVTPLNLRFYISGVALLRVNAEAVPVDLVTTAGVPVPYGVHLYNAEELASATLRVLAPAGMYSGITFLLGLDGGCNSRLPGSSKVPLSDTSQMTWPPEGYLFLRYEGRLAQSPDGNGDGGLGADADAGSGPANGADASTAALPPPSAIHMGGRPRLPLAPVIRVEGAFSVPAGGSISKNVRLVMDEVFRGALTPTDLTGFTGPPGNEVDAGERLRRNAPQLRLFVFGP